MAAALGNAENSMDLMRRMAAEERAYVYAFFGFCDPGSSSAQGNGTTHESWKGVEPIPMPVSNPRGEVCDAHVPCAQSCAGPDGAAQVL